MDVYVFKTSVRYKKQVKSLKPSLDRLLAKNSWHFDLEDCDKVFRVEAPENVTGPVMELLRTNGFACDELV